MSHSRNIALSLLLAAGLQGASPVAHAQGVGPAPAKATAKPVTAKPGGDAATANAASKKADPAAAQSTIDAAAKQLEAGKPDSAVAALTSVISAGNLPPVLMARALYLRGAAYRKQSKPALAISDLTSALWLKGGLNDADRKEALLQRTAAYGEAGLTDQGQVTTAGSAAVQSDGTAREPRRSKEPLAGAASLAPKATAETAAPPAAASGGLFGGLFGGGGAPKTAAAPAVPAPVPAPAAGAAANAWSNTVKTAKTQPGGGVAAPATVAAATVAAAPAARSQVEGSYRSRIALVRTKAEADAVVAKLKSQFAAAIAGRTPEIGQAAFGNMGSFFQVRVGPFASAAEAQALCGRLKGSGLDCVPVDR